MMTHSDDDGLYNIRMIARCFARCTNARCFSFNKRSFRSTNEVFFVQQTNMFFVQQAKIFFVQHVDGLFSPLKSIHECINTPINIAISTSTHQSIRQHINQYMNTSISAFHTSILNTSIRYRAVGRAMVKCLYEGRRIGSRLAPSVFKFITGTEAALRDLQVGVREVLFTKGNRLNIYQVIFLDKNCGRNCGF